MFGARELQAEIGLLKQSVQHPLEQKTAQLPGQGMWDPGKRTGLGQNNILMGSFA